MSSFFEHQHVKEREDRQESFEADLDVKLMRSSRTIRAVFFLTFSRRR